MQQFPHNAWYIACYATDLQDSPLPRIILGQPVVLWRDTDGTAAAIEDRCPHRRVSLSNGQIQGDLLQCGYHGLKFDRTGICRSVPGQERIPAAARVRSYKIVERDGFVWLWPGDPAHASADTIPDYSIAGSPCFAGKRFQVHVRADALLSVENVMDLSHVAFAHPGTVGNGFVAEVEPVLWVEGSMVAVRREMRGVPNAPLYARIMGIAFADRTQEIRFWPGGNIVLHSTVKPAGANGTEGQCTIIAHAPVTPETARSHRQFLAMYRDFKIEDDALTELIADQFLKTVREDMALIEDQQNNLDADGPDAPMIDIRVDAGPLTARRLLKQACQRERSEALEPSR